MAAVTIVNKASFTVRFPPIYPLSLHHCVQSVYFANMAKICAFFEVCQERLNEAYNRRRMIIKSCARHLCGSLMRFNATYIFTESELYSLIQMHYSILLICESFPQCDRTRTRHYFRSSETSGVELGSWR